MSFLASLLTAGERVGARTTSAPVPTFAPSAMAPVKAPQPTLSPPPASAKPVSVPAPAALNATGANMPALSVNPLLMRPPADQAISSPSRIETAIAAIATPLPNADATPSAHANANATPTKKLRVLFAGTYPVGQTNGYAKVVYYICKNLGTYDDIDLHIWGFQNYNQARGVQRNDIPASVTLHDALAKEEPKRNGFGEKEFGPFLKENPIYDLVIIFNDMVITSSLTASLVGALTPEERKKFKLISYMDQVYPFQRPQYIKMLNDHFDAVIAFTPYWAEIARGLGITKPMYSFPHGFDKEVYYPVDKRLARLMFNLPLDAYVVGTTNRAQPRKALNHTMVSWAICVERHWKLRTEATKAGTAPPRPMIFVIGSAANGYWNLEEIWVDQMRRRGIPNDEGAKYITFLPNPQTYTDREINILYNAFDVHVSNVLGEGFGLIAFECAGIGCGVVAPDLGGHREFLLPEHSILVKPFMESYLDNQTDGIGGMAEISNPVDIADGLWKYYTEPKVLKKHGAKARDYILTHFQWPTMVRYFHDMLLHLRGGASPHDASGF